MKNILYTLALICIASQVAQAQDILTANLSWTTTHVVDQDGGASFAYQSTFKTNGDDSVDWLQGGKTYQYTVTQVVGTWPSVGSDGEIVYKISAGAKTTGEIKFSRTGSTINARLRTTTEGGTDQDLLFTVSSIQTY